MSNNIQTMINNLSTPKQVTYEGGYMYPTTLEDDLCTLFTIGSVHGTFYIDSETMIKEMDSVLKTALKECPELATKYAIYSAETLRMKLVPTVWLVYLSTLEDKTLFNKAFPRIINKNIKLLHDFVNLCRSTNIRPGGHMSQKIKPNNRGLGSSLKKTINSYLNQIMNSYNVTRFTNKLEDICHLTRIKDTEDNIKYLKYIFKPQHGGRRLTFERAQLLQETIDILSNPEHSSEQFVKALDNITQAQIQMDEIKFTFGHLSNAELRQVYIHFIPTLKYAALVTNLVAIERVFATSKMGNQVLDTDIPTKLVELVANRLSSIEDFKRSGLFFMRLYSASRMIVTSQWAEAMDKVFKQMAKEAFKDIPDNMRIRCSADTSGSMRGTPVTNNSKVWCADVAAYFVAACALSIPNTDAYATASITKRVALNSDSIEACAQQIATTKVGYDTNFETLLEGYKGENVVLLITDTQQSDNVYQSWRNLNKPEDAKFIIWDVAGNLYRNVISSPDPSFIYLRGYSDRNLQLISDIIMGKAGQKSVVNNVVI